MAKTRIKGMAATSRESACYKIAQEKVPNWTSKGR